MSFQACPDVAGTESTVEELTCLATWKDGNSRYLVGLVSHHHATSNEERYRCFVYEKMAGSGGSKEAEYKLAQSGDATCNGLDSAEVQYTSYNQTEDVQGKLRLIVCACVFVFVNLITGGFADNDTEEGTGCGSMRLSAVVQGTQALALDHGQLWVCVPPERRVDAHHQVQWRAGDACPLRTDQ